MLRAMLGLALAVVSARAETPLEAIPLQITWGYPGVGETVSHVSVEAGEGLAIYGLLHFRPGDGATNGLQLMVRAPNRSSEPIQDLNIIWADLLAAADADTSTRLGRDAAMFPGSPRLYVKTEGEASRGFALTLEQIKQQPSFWVPAYGIYVACGAPFVSFQAHQRELAHWRGRRILERVEAEPEASYEQFAEQWEDMGSPLYTHPQQRGPGHIICLAWDSEIHKFGIDRGGGVRNDLGNPDQFQFWLDVGDITKGVARLWRNQRLVDGMPVVVTTLEKEHVRYELEQFAFPLDGSPPRRAGNVPMVLMQRLRLSSLDHRPSDVTITLCHRRRLTTKYSSQLGVQRRANGLALLNESSGETLLELDGADRYLAIAGVHDYDPVKLPRADITIALRVPAAGVRNLTVKLPSPAAGQQASQALSALDYENARQQTLMFWTSWLKRGARFEVPEQVVNDLFRASLWHALRLPRRLDGDPLKIDLPYSNFAYDQTGTPWPINQSVYVDYMLYGLRGYDAVAAEELNAQYRNNQAADGHISGYANWMAYTPGLLYAVGENYLLSGDRATFEQNLPQSLKALDWCLEQVGLANARTTATKGLIEGPLNDGTGNGAWAFNQAYFSAGLGVFSKALEAFGHPRAAQARTAAREIAEAAARAFHYASTRSPLVQLADHTWTPYVPTEASTFGRLVREWYPADVDTGPLHMVRLQLIPARGDLAGWLLNDHEDNLYIRQWGMANEPVYNQQATAYLLRDEPKAVIRSFYSYMASAFSHSALEPVEHRFTHGQYFGPPSTDGAWFELFRNMLVMERDDDTLLLCGFTPRKWLESGKHIVVERAPTRFGQVSLSVSTASSSQIEATIDVPRRTPPGAVLLRLRHVTAKPIRAVAIDGRPWTDFDRSREWIRIRSPGAKKYSIQVTY